MSIRFAAPAHSLACLVSPAGLRRLRRVPANDNARKVLASDESDEENTLIFRAALHHFARHGAAAARVAFAEAEQCRQQGDAENYGRWLDICQTLDRRLALRLQAQCAS